jgi:hypothetical protein
VVTALLRVAPLDDEDLLEAVQRSFRQVILPELERLGADEFVLSQVRSTLSMVGFVRRGLTSRLVAQAEAEKLLTIALERRGIALDTDVSPVEFSRRTSGLPEIAALLREQLHVEVQTRTGSSHDQ